MLSVRFEVGVSLLVAPAGADKSWGPFPLVENAGIEPAPARDSQESTCRSSGGSRVLLNALQSSSELKNKVYSWFLYIVIMLIMTTVGLW